MVIEALQMGIAKMNLLLPVIFFALAACAPSEAQFATQTEEARPTATNTLTPSITPTASLTLTPSVTFTPSLTLTPSLTPTPTPTPLPEPLAEALLNTNALVLDTFDPPAETSRYQPTGWQVEHNHRILANVDGAVEINGVTTNNIVFFQQPVLKNQAVYLLFKFTEGSYFTIGVDGLMNGKRVPFDRPGFTTVAMQMRSELTVHLIHGFLNDPVSFEGELVLEPDTWYAYSIVLTEANEFAISIWSPDDPQRRLTYKTQRDGMPDEYIFILWLGKNAKLYLDDFTILEFTRLMSN